MRATEVGPGGKQDEGPWRRGQLPVHLRIVSELEKITNKGKSQVPTCGVTFDDDVFWREADDIHKIIVPCKCVDERGRERVASLVWMSHRQSVLDCKSAPTA